MGLQHRKTGAVRKPRPSEEPKSYAGSLDKPSDLLTQLDLARARIDRATALMERALHLRQQMEWGVFDLDDLVDEVHAFRRDCRALRWRAPW
jgi:hypothetical protein